MIDLFCSNGSTWYNKKYFINNVIKNDLRSGKYLVGSEKHSQILDIITDTNIDILNYKLEMYPFMDEVVYLDPPHLLNTKTGIMVQKYGKLDSLIQIENLAYNCSLISSKYLIIKWYDKDLKIDKFLDYFRPYFVDTIKFGDRKKSCSSWLIIMIKKDSR